MNYSLEYFKCPINGQHTFYNENRYLKHIYKCQRKHPKCKLYQCPYSARHFVPVAEKMDHLMTCPSRVPLLALTSGQHFTYVETDSEALNAEEDWSDNTPISWRAEQEAQAREKAIEEVKNEKGWEGWNVEWEDEPDWWDFGETPPSKRRTMPNKLVKPGTESDEDPENEDDNVVSLEEILAKKCKVQDQPAANFQNNLKKEVSPDSELVQGRPSSSVMGSLAIKSTMCEVEKASATPLTRVELHSHLDGSVRAETVWELAKAKGVALPGDGSFRALKDTLVIRDPIDLAHFLQPFRIIIPCLQNDLRALERIAYEFIADKARDSVAYVEARFAPHALLTDSMRDMPHLEGVVAAVSRGLARGREEFGVDSRILLCSLIGLDTAEEVLALCERTRDLGVVGIDTASTCDGTTKRDEVPEGGREQEVFQRAAQIGLHRTVHAGERGPAEMVRRAVELYRAERIGHGYRVVEDLQVYAEVRRDNIHLECCPWSSFLTGAVPMGIRQHPIARFAEDQINFSVNTDDTTVTGHTLTEDYALFESWGLTEAQSLRASLNAAKSAFITENERRQLVQRILSQIVPEER